LGVDLADWAPLAADWPSFWGVFPGFLPSLVGVLGALACCLPAAGEGAIVSELRVVVLLEEVVLDEDPRLVTGDCFLSGVGGKE
jgi:hypothetical protein